MKELIWACAAVTRAVSLLRNMRGATSAANNAMIVTTTSISIKVTPACGSLLRWFISHRHFVYARDGQKHAEDQRTHHHTHHQDHQGFEQRRKALDRRSRITFINVRHASKHVIEPARFFANRQEMAGQWGED